MTPEEQKNLEDKVKAIKQLAKTLNMDLSKMTDDFMKDLSGNADAIELTFSSLNRQLRQTQENFNDIQKSLQASIDAVISKNSKVNQLTSNFKGLSTILSKLVSDEEGWSDLGKDEIKKALEKTKILERQAQINALSILSQATGQNYLDKDLSKQEEKVKLLQEIEDGIIKGTLALTEQQRELLQATLTPGQDNFFTRTITQAEKRLRIEEKTHSAMGITGALLENINKVGARVFGGIGLNLSAFGNELENAKDKVKDLSKAFAGKDFVKAISLGFKGTEEQFNKLANSVDKGGSKFSGFVDRFRVRMLTMKAGLPGIRKAVVEAFNDPLTIAITLASNIIQAFKTVDKETTALTRMIGETSALKVQTMTYNMALVDTVDLLKQAATLTQLTGLNAAQAFSEDNIVGAADAVNYLGLSNEEAGKLVILAEATGKSFKDNTNSIIKGVNNFNQLNKTAVSHGLIMKSVASTSDAIKASLGSSVDSITQAASAAARLGMELKDLDNIASSLLDFESSIEAELEAQLLTGRNINLSKARELALNNNLKGLGEEIFKNSVDLLEYGNMNRLQQESYAKALGVNRDQLAKIAYQRGIENNLSREALKIATGMTEEELRRMEVTEMINKIISKTAQAFTPLLEGVLKFSKEIGIALGIITSLYVIFKSFKGLGAILRLSDAVKAGGILGGIKSIGTVPVATSGTAAAPAAATLATPATTAASTASKATTITARAAQTAQTVPPTAGVGVRKFLTDLSKGLMAMGLPGVPVGTTTLSVSTPAIRAAVLNTRTVTPASAGKVKVFLTSLSQGLVQMVKAGPGVKVLAGTALAFTLMTAAIPAMAFIAGLGPAVGAGLKAISTGLAGLGKAGVGALKGIGILGLLGVALIPLTYALSLLAPLVKEVFTGFSNLLEGLTMEKLGGLFALGPALMVAAGGLTAFSAAMTLGGLGAGIINLLTGGGLLGQLGTLAEMAQPLAGVGASLMAISAGLQAVADATEKIEVEKIKELDGLVTNTAQTAPFLVATKAIGDIIGNIGTKQETTSTPVNEKLINKLDELINIVKKDKHIYIGGNQVEQSIAIGRTKQS